MASLALAWHLLITQVYGTAALQGFYLRIKRGVNDGALQLAAY
ncbi:hypothetical protein [Pseudomonas turukhanskensis]|nr:hypothetical protein [Pseudomonas turukhanskensis]